MDQKPDTEKDLVDGIVDDVLFLYPGSDVTGLPVTGRIMRLARYVEAFREEHLAAFGLSVADFDVLATMRRRAADQPINVRDLQRSMMLSSGGTTKRLDRLEKAELIQRLRDPNDRRGVLIQLTPKGVRLIDEAIPAMRGYENDLVGRALTSQRDRTNVANGLRKMLLAQERAAQADTDE
jgi:DNA-binding MarR family transcriptional regulator